MKKGKNKILDSERIADYILSLSDPDVGDYISNLKLQKLLYYCQGFYLALNNKLLFKEPIMAWALGPVVENIYKKYKGHGENAIIKPSHIDFSQYNVNQVELISEVHKIYGQFSAWKLSDLTHSEIPWKNTKQSTEIKIDLLKSFFKTLLIK